MSNYQSKVLYVEPGPKFEYGKSSSISQATKTQTRPSAFSIRWAKLQAEMKEEREMQEIKEAVAGFLKKIDGLIADTRKQNAETRARRLQLK